jgi:hypothetical protein
MELAHTPFEKLYLNDLDTYEGEIPSILGCQIAVVRAGYYESLVYCNETKLEALREKYGSSFLRVAGTALRDPRPAIIRKRPKYTPGDDENDYDILRADQGLNFDPDEENERLKYKYRSSSQMQSGEIVYKPGDYVKSDEEEDDTPVVKVSGLNIDLDKMLRGVRTLTPKEREVFARWEKGERDSTIASALGVKQATLKQYKAVISIKLRGFYGSSSYERFCADIIRVYKLVQSKGLVPISEQVPIEERRRGPKSSKRPVQSPLKTDSKVRSIRSTGHLKNGETSPQEIQTSIQNEEVIPVWVNPPLPVEIPVTKELPIPTFNDFIQAYGNRKDAVKALEQFNKIPLNERPLIMADIPSYKKSLSNAASQKSPYAYLLSASWRSTVR